MNRHESDNQLARRILTYATLAALVGLVLVLSVKGTRNEVEIGPSNDKVEVSPTQIESIKDIKEWEFLTVDLEEIADTTAERTFGSDRKLTRIYYGTLRLGVNLDKTKKNWVKMVGDTVDVTLPKVELLDQEFIDEAKTRAFFEVGTWDQASRNALYQQARRKMLSRGLTVRNMDLAQLNAVEQFTTLFKAMGYEYVDVHF